MSVIGIVAEFNPLHKGHEYLIKKAKEQGFVVCVISSNFVQRGETAIAEKRIRALAALNCGADLVLELPVLWSMSTAQNFALGAVSILKNAGCDTIMFGSECGEIEPLEKAADVLQGGEFSNALEKELKKGITFAAARQKAAELCGVQKGLLQGANNNLGIEYILAAKHKGFDIRFKTIKRIGAEHDSTEIAEFVSASYLRERLLQGDYEFCEKYMPNESLSLLTPDKISDISRIEKAVLGVLRTKTQNELKRLPDLSEGVENKLFKAIRLAGSLEELYNEIKVKRYTLARIRRLVLNAFIGADDEFFMKSPPYIRVLGFSKSGQELLKTLCSAVPIIKRIADIRRLDLSARRVFEAECRATDLFSLSLPKAEPCGLEYTAKLIKTE